jgi:hypothetical protein
VFKFVCYTATIFTTEAVKARELILIGLASGEGRRSWFVLWRKLARAGCFRQMTSWTLDSLGSRKAEQLAEHGKLAAILTVDTRQPFIIGGRGLWSAGQLGNRESEKIFEIEMEAGLGWDRLDRLG